MFKRADSNMMKKIPFLTVSVSLLLHSVIIANLINRSYAEHSLQHRADIGSPVVSIALSQAIEQAKLPETKIEPPIVQHDLPVSPAIVETAKIIVPKKEKKTERKPATKESNKMVVSKENTEQQEKKDYETEKTAAQPQPLMSQNGENASSQAMGAMGKPVQGFSIMEDSGELSAYREKLRREIERNKQYPRRASSMKIRGTTEVVFNLTITGEFTSARVITSSGHELLDNAALAAVAKSRSVGVPPEGFKSQVSFEIKFQ